MNANNMPMLRKGMPPGKSVFRQSLVVDGKQVDFQTRIVTMTT
jgi:hypothetical protein